MLTALTGTSLEPFSMVGLRGRLNSPKSVRRILLRPNGSNLNMEIQEVTGKVFPLSQMQSKRNSVIKLGPNGNSSQLKMLQKTAMDTNMLLPMKLPMELKRSRQKRSYRLSQRMLSKDLYLKTSCQKRRICSIPFGLIFYVREFIILLLLPVR